MFFKQFMFAQYSGGSGDGFASQQFTLTSCLNPPQFYAYAGGTGDGTSMNQFTITSCFNPPQFYAYMGGGFDGVARDMATYCPTNPPVANFSGTTNTICVGQTVSFTDLSSQSPSAWLWNFQGGTPSTSSVQNPTITYNVPGTYSVSLTAYNAMGSNTYSVINYITVNAIPVASAGTNSAICAGSSAILNASGGINYTWTPGSGLSNSNISNPIANPSVTTVYTVNVSNGFCSSTNAITLTIIPLPIANAGNNVSICLASNTTLTASGGSSYSWSPSAGLNSVTNPNPVANPTTTTIYTLTAFNSGCSSTDFVTVSVNPLPTATISANGPTTFCQGGNVILSSSIGDSYQWSNSAITPTISVTASGNFFVTVSNSFSCAATSAAISVVVNPLGTASITPNSSTTFCQGDSVTLVVNSGNSYAWSTGATTQNIVAYSSGIYSVEVTNSNNCTTPTPSASIVVTVNQNPAIPTITAIGSTSLCIGDTVILKSTSASSYLWNTGAVVDSIIVTTAGNYSVTAFNSFGCSALSSITSVSVNDPLVDFSGNPLLVFIPNANVTFTATPNGVPPYSYLWNFGNSSTSTNSSPNNTYNSIGYYTVSLKLTDNTGCSKTITKTNYVQIEQLFPSYPMITGTTIDITDISFIDAVTGIMTLSDGNCVLSADSGNTWSPLATGNTNQLYSAHVLPGNWFVGGANGTILHSTNNGLNWNTLNTGTLESFYGCSFLAAPLSGFAVGTNGTIKYYDGVNWLNQTSGTTAHLNNVHTFNNGNAILAGDNSTVLFYNGTSWSPQTLPLSFNVKDIRFTTINDGYAAGSNGIVIKTIDGGNTWTPSLTGVNIDFNSVETVGLDSAWATGTDGIIYRTIDAGSSWTRYSVGTTNTQNAARVKGGKGHVAGNSGNGRNFNPNTSGTVTILNQTEVNHQNISIFPIPSKNQVNLSTNFDNVKVLSIQIKDVQGKLIDSFNYKNISGLFNLKINTEYYSNGIYFVHIDQDNNSWTQKFVVEK
ncbi:MAG: PKD domain-containing protein [Bacteroidia bacterium]|nr:PKD domain-containing protein [Bacteroidia bacterium]